MNRPTPALLAALIALATFAQPAHAMPASVPYAGTQLRIFNQYDGPDACYVAVYSHRKRGAAYAVGPFYVHGLIRLKGHYDEDGIAQPAGWRGRDISASADFKEMAGQAFPQAKGDAWVGGDTQGIPGLRFE